MLTPDLINVVETSKTPVRLLLTRSGKTFSFGNISDSRISLPSEVMIPKGQASVYVYLNLVSNQILDDLDSTLIVISGNGYDESTAVMNIEDDTYPSLTMVMNEDEVTEGETFELTITAERAPKDNLDLKLSCESPERFVIPSIVLPAGETQVTVTVATRDDEIPDVTKSVMLTVSADGYNKFSDIIDLLDNDVPDLQLALTPNAVSEASGPVSVIATLTRTDNVDKAVTVKFSDDSNGNLYYGRESVEMAAGVKELTLNLGPIDNSIVDGERLYNITAAVWIASCSCNASNGTSGGQVTVPLTVYDNDGPALTVVSSASVLKEGSDLVVTVSRNTDVSSALTVNVHSDHDERLEIPSYVTIPAGETSASFIVTSLNDEVENQDFTLVLTVEAEGFAKGNLWVMVSDQTLPDAQVLDISVSDNEIEVGQSVTVKAEIVNRGSYELPELTRVGIYRKGENAPLATAYLQAPLQPEDSVMIEKTISLPEAVGKYGIYAVVNADQDVKELIFSNNVSRNVEVEVKSPFKFIIDTDKSIYRQNEAVQITGVVEGRDVAHKDIDVYVVNDGIRQVMKTTTDDNGGFQVKYQPYEGQMGHFKIGACYPNENSSEEYLSFDVYGIKRVGTQSVICEMTMGETYNGVLMISNPGNLPITNLKSTVVTQFEDCIVELDCPSEIPGGRMAGIAFSITPARLSEGNDWEQFAVEVSSSEGAVLKIPVYYYCYNTSGKLKSSVTTIKTTMVKDAGRDYPFEIVNIGKGTTGKISLALPDWMSAATPMEMASLENGESATVVLRFLPNDGMQLNVPVTGQIGVNCENGDGVAIPFSIEPVSEATGTLTIDVCDEYTYYTTEAPHVIGAEVRVSHPTTGALIASGVTDENGLFSVTLNEGYYAVAVNAANHDSYRNNILVDPASEKKVAVNLSVEAITINWNVEETEVEDEYKIVTTAKYETNVPVPVVEMVVPNRIPAKDLGVGESLIFNAVLTNHGLITAKNTQLLMPEGFTSLLFEPLDYTAPFDLAPKQSVMVPIKVTHIDASTQSRAIRALNLDNDPCAAQPGTLYFWDCGEDRKLHRVRVAIQVGTCKSNDPSTWDNTSDNGDYSYSGAGGIVPVPHTGGGSSYSSSSNSNRLSTTASDCHPSNPDYCLPKAFLGCATGLPGCFFKPNPWTITGCITSALLSCSDITSWWGVANCGLGWAGCLLSNVPYVSCGLSVVGCLSGLAQCWLENRTQIKSKLPSVVPHHIDGHDIALIADVVTVGKERYLELVGDSVWLNVTQENLDLILDYVDDHIADNGELVLSGDWTEIKPEMVSANDMSRLLERFANTSRREIGKAVEGNNYVNMDVIRSYDERLQSYKQEMIDAGYEDYEDFIDDVMLTLNNLADELEESSNSVCSSITLQFNQKMVMTRQAFKGTLTVSNGNEDGAMTGVKLNLIVTDDEGDLATDHEMQVNLDSLLGFEGSSSLENEWSLQPKETGIAEILFIPTKFAAPTVEKAYWFGGTLTYVDPFTGLEVTRKLTPVALTVKPSPNLDLTYFIQRDILGDDPMTEAVEPCEEAEFSLLITNQGYGDATNVRMVTDQPEIIDNEKGLKIDFELMSSQLNGEEKTLAFGNSVATDFGTIPAQSSAYAQWWLKGSLLGHFTDYKVEATHVTSYDNPDLSGQRRSSVAEG